MEVTKHEQSLIHEVMLMAYEQGIEEGKRQALEAIKKTKAGDYSHNPAKNSYSDDWRRP